MTVMPLRERAADRRAGLSAWLVIWSAVLVAGCATGRHGDHAAGHGPAGDVGEGSLPFFERDGPDPHPPDGLGLVPDAEPRLEAIRPGGPNKPYEALGLAYVPLLDDRPYTERGLATWYGRKFHGHRTSSGEPYDMYAMTAAHPVLPIPSYARVRNPANGREVIVRINDRGPFHSGRVIDLSYTAALKLGVLRGATQVEVQHITGDDIRTGAWRGPGASAAVAMAAPAPTLTAQVATLTAQVATQPSRLPMTVPSPSPSPSTAPGPYQSAVRSPPGVTALPPQPLAPGLPTLADPGAADNGALGTASPVSSPTATLVPIDLSPPTPPTAPTPPAASAGPQPTSTTIASQQTAPAVEQAAIALPTWWLQLGAFHQRDAADRLSQDVASGARWLAPLLAIAADARWFRLQAGPYATVADARDAAERLRRDLRLPTTIVPRR